MKKSDKEKKINRLIKGHGWFSLIVFLLFSVIAALLLAHTVFTVGSYMLQNKIASEYESVSYMARIYDLSLQSEYSDNVWDILDAEGSEYIIRDNDGRLIHGDKNNTCFKKGGFTHIANVEGEVEIYPDNGNTYIWVGDNGEIRLNWIGLFKLIGEDYDAPESDVLIINEDAIDEQFNFFGGFAFSFSTGIQIRLPLWIGFDVNGGAEKFIGKGYVSVMLGDLAITISAVMAVTLLLIVIFFLFLANMTGNIRNKKRVKKVMFGDLATGGRNQTYFTYYGEKNLRKGWAARQDFAVVDLHIVRYSSFCMCHSVADGEDILRRISACIKKQIKWRELFAHASGGEFHLLLKVKDQDQLTERLRVLITELEKVETAHAFRYHLGVSMIPPFRKPNGSIAKRKWVNLEQECNNAAAARKTIDGKESSDIAFFDVKLLQERKWHDLVEENCKQALENGDFVVFYQPKYNPKSGLLLGAEALIRWRSSNPEFAEPGSFVSPGKFIPIFEQNGFITEIDHYMLKHVAADQKKWLDQGFTCVPVSVNVSRAHFIEPDLAEQIRDIVDREGAPRNLIEIELTESAFFDDKNALVRTINTLKGYGFTVSMDDFGSGYSSLNSLKDMPLDVLKLDAEFFRGENANDRGKKVVSETIRLARRLGMHTVAEGVEVKSFVDFLADEECDMIQGFYFEKPMPGSDYEVMMKKRVTDKPLAHASENEEVLGDAADDAAVQNAVAERVEQESGVAEGTAIQSTVAESVEQEIGAAEEAVMQSTVADSVEQESDAAEEAVMQNTVTEDVAIQNTAAEGAVQEAAAADDTADKTES
ncbi:MAG: EAL domain-containing protein [Lachnospiraceae bacterium]|nr:EAL domain-containing protein [Lachnospiraceae bacterium]